MNEQEQRIALCEWAGWTEVAERLNCYYHEGEFVVCGLDPIDFGTGNSHQVCPDTSSLDVLHEMEKRLWNEDSIQQKFNDYVDQLCKVVNCFDTAHLIHATAAQRREAILRTLGLWRENAGETK